jgi:CRP/FNR family transcriptional regulator, cyclic AMP receptor protein
MATDPSVVNALAATDLFGSLSKRALGKIATSAKVVHHGPGEELTTQGNGGIAFHLITDGSASVSVRGTGRQTLGPGEYFGEISLIDGKPRSATVTAQTPLTTLSLVSWQFTPLLDEEPDVTKGLLLALCQRLRASEQAKTGEQ